MVSSPLPNGAWVENSMMDFAWLSARGRPRTTSGRLLIERHGKGREHRPPEAYKPGLLTRFRALTIELKYGLLSMVVAVMRDLRGKSLRMSTAEDARGACAIMHGKKGKKSLSIASIG